MAWETQRSSGFDLRPDCCKGGVYGYGACLVFDGMLTSEFEDWRSPNRILEVTIHKVCYPITESLLHQVFGPFGVVEQVQVFGGLDCVLAQVIFKSKYDAVEAFAELHGRNIYDGCCQLDIHYAVSTKPDISMARSDGDTAASSQSVWFCSAAATMSTLDDNFNSEKLPVVSDASGAHVEATAVAAATHGDIDDIVDQPMVARDTEDHDVSNELQAPLVSTVTEVFIPNYNIDVFTPKNSEAAPDSQLSITMLHSDYSRCLEVDIGMLLAMGSLSGYDDCTQEYIPMPLSMCDETAVALRPSPVKGIEWLPWLPPTKLKITGDSAGIRPRPWPYFHRDSGISSFWCFGWYHPPTWLFPTRQNCSYVPVEILEYLQQIDVISVRVVTLEPWPPPRTGASLYNQLHRCCLMLLQVTRQQQCDGIAEFWELTLDKATANTWICYQFVCLSKQLSSVSVPELVVLELIIYHLIGLELSEYLEASIGYAQSIMLFENSRKCGHEWLEHAWKVLPSNSFWLQTLASYVCTVISTSPGQLAKGIEALNQVVEVFLHTTPGYWMQGFGKLKHVGNAYLLSYCLVLHAYPKTWSTFWIVAVLFMQITEAPSMLMRNTITKVNCTKLEKAMIFRIPDRIGLAFGSHVILQFHLACRIVGDTESTATEGQIYAKIVQLNCDSRAPMMFMNVQLSLLGCCSIQDIIQWKCGGPISDSFKMLMPEELVHPWSSSVDTIVKITSHCCDCILHLVITLGTIQLVGYRKFLMSIERTVNALGSWWYWLSASAWGQAEP